MSIYVTFLGSNPISWAFYKQRIIIRLSIENEYKLVASTTSKICWFVSPLRELHVSISTTLSIYYNNISTPYIYINPVFHSRMKHFAVDFHFVRENVAFGNLMLANVSFSNQLTIVTISTTISNLMKQNLMSFCTLNHEGA